MHARVLVHVDIHAFVDGSPPYFLRSCLSLTLDLTSSVRLMYSKDLLVSASPGLGLQASTTMTDLYLCGFWGCKLRTSCFGDKHVDD